jgi:hypothetical protein
MVTTANESLSREAIIKQIEEDIVTDVDLSAGETQTVRANNEKVTLYSMVDGAPRPVLKNDAPRLLAKKLQGTTIPAFWVEGMPGEAPEYILGDVSCMLHPDFDELDGASGLNRAFVDEAGLAGRTCNMADQGKINRNDFKSVYDRDDHMAKKHRREWATIKDSQSARERDRDREDRRADREAMVALATATSEKATEGAQGASGSKSKG